MSTTHAVDGRRRARPHRCHRDPAAGRAGLGQPCAAGWYSLNGNGEMTGTTWIEESGSFNLPVVLSNTHAIGACHTGVIRWVTGRRRFGRRRHRHELL